MKTILERLKPEVLKSIEKKYHGTPEALEYIKKSLRRERLWSALPVGIVYDVTASVYESIGNTPIYSILYGDGLLIKD